MRISKRTLSGLTLAAVIGVAVALLMHLFRDAEFLIANETPYPVSVVAAWRNQIDDLGAIPPSTTYRFSLRDEAAMTFTAQYPDGRQMESEEIYFTAGTGVVATITESGIQVRYDFERRP